MIILIIVMLLLSSGCVHVEERETKIKKTEKAEQEKMVDVLFIIAEQNFRDEELFYTKEEIEEFRLTTEVASKTKGMKKGTLGARAEANLSLKDVKVENYKAVIFVGGQGSSQYFDDEEALNIAKTAKEKNKVVGAICIAPVILANSGILEKKKATVWNGEYIKKLEEEGAIFVNKTVVQDGKIITANGPAAARQFGRTIADAIK